MEGFEILKMLGAAGDLSTLAIVFLVYHQGQKIKDWVREQLDPIKTSITRIETKIEIIEATMEKADG